MANGSVSMQSGEALATPPLQQTASRLLTLIPELRNEIYRLVLRNDEPLEVAKNNLRSRATLLRVCKQIRNEAASIFYGENAFTILLDGELETTKTAAAWLKSLGGHAKLLRRMVVYVAVAKDVRSKIEMALFAARLLGPDDPTLNAHDAGRGRADGRIIGQALAEVDDKYDGPASSEAVFRSAGLDCELQKAYYEGVKAELRSRLREVE